MLPKHPENSKKVTGLDTVAELKEDEEYLIDGRVKKAQIGFNWTASQVDVDASLAAFDKEYKLLDVVFWDKKHSHYLAADLLNDDKTGEKSPGSTANETIQVRNSTLSSKVRYVLLRLTSKRFQMQSSTCSRC